jgi:hypothetical protein
LTFQILSRIYLAMKGKRRPGWCGETSSLTKIEITVSYDILRLVSRNVLEGPDCKLQSTTCPISLENSKSRLMWSLVKRVMLVALDIGNNILKLTVKVSRWCVRLFRAIPVTEFEVSAVFMCMIIRDTLFSSLPMKNER